MADKEVDDLEQLEGTYFQYRTRGHGWENKAAKCTRWLHGQLLSQQVLLSILIRVFNACTHTLAYTQTHTQDVITAAAHNCGLCFQSQNDAIPSLSPVPRSQKTQSAINLQTAARDIEA